MLESKGISYTYREYTKEPLSKAEISDVLRKLKLNASDVLRTRDANKLGLTGKESAEELVALMAQHPKLMQRPIGVVGDKAAVGRPPEALLELI